MRRDRVVRRVLRPLVGLGLLSAMQLTFGPAGVATAGLTPTQQDRSLVERGRDLYNVGCVTCHGADGRGNERWPSIVNSGAAGAYFYLSTGRMPQAVPGPQAHRKPPAYDEEEIDALVAFVASLGNGPPIPTVDPEFGNLQRGGELYRFNCAACHAYAGSGGALQDGQNAPNLYLATPTQVAAAIRIGPGTMPKFGQGAISETDLNDITAYTEYLKNANDRGGANLGYRGPIPEGFVAWFGGLALMVAATLWIGSRR